MSQQVEALPIDESRVEEFTGQFIADLSASYSGVMTLLGHELGLYKAMDSHGPITARELATQTDTYERYVREWLNNQAAGGYVLYDPVNETYELPAEHALILSKEESTIFMATGYFIVSSLWHDKDKVVNAFKSGEGIGWHEHHQNLFVGVEDIYRAGYKANLTDVWIPYLDGIEEKLDHGGRVADIGCGHGASVILMAEKYPNSEFYGFDYHAESIATAKKRAEEAGLTNVFFEQVDAESYAGDNFDLICYFDCFHDFGNPLQAIRYARNKLSEDGSLMLVEPNAGDKVEDNFNPVGRMFYAASTALCVPHSHSQEGDYCLGAQAGPAVVEEIAHEAGFSYFRIADQNPFNLVFEIKK